MLYHIICDLIPFNVIVWYNSYFHMLYHIFHNVIPLFLTVYTRTTINTNTLIDNIITNSKHILTSGIIESDITDHSILFFIFYFKHTNLHNTNTKPFIRNKKNINDLKKELNIINWQNGFVSK